MKVTYTEEAIADIVEAISYLNERNPSAAANLDAEIARCIERLANPSGHDQPARLKPREFALRRSRAGARVSNQLRGIEATLGLAEKHAEDALLCLGQPPATLKAREHNGV